jgi:hypothetical protein
VALVVLVAGIARLIAALEFERALVGREDLLQISLFIAQQLKPAAIRRW